MPKLYLRIDGIEKCKDVDYEAPNVEVNDLEELAKQISPSIIAKKSIKGSYGLAGSYIIDRWSNNIEWPISFMTARNEFIYGFFWIIK
ncbi:MAG TPA: hypothetical protein PKV16_09040 [Caldisericia bacterium]|nr:hypothetical protein [Caldisericia bacterium]HPQ93907.1 hypothetical protein [Caldisericia bacterium]HRV75709.1 hypothetical protein [Caldisericia bacterium]HXK76618.1 hypothetical protein [Bacteroidaceae bacterium]